MKNLYGTLLMGALLAAASVVGSQPAGADDSYRRSDGYRQRPYAGGAPQQTASGQWEWSEGEEYLRRRDGRLISRRQLEFERDLRTRILQQPLNQGGWQLPQVPYRQR